MEDGKIKVIYCMGSGRSGSTLLNIILSNHTEIFGAGELNNIKGFENKKFECSCGKNIENCNFWSNVLERWRNAPQKETPGQTMVKIDRIENFKSPIAWIKLLMGYPFQSNYFENYLESTFNFFKAISEESESPIIMDISKNPLRALVLHYHPKIDLRLIHLVRDGRGVAWSLNKYEDTDIRKKSISRTALFWTIINRQSNFVRKKQKNSEMILYEDLVNFPKSTLSKIAKFTDFYSEPITELIKGNLAQEESHILAGNQLRKSKNIILKLDNSWKENLSEKQINSFLKIAKSTMKNYGYLTEN